MKINKREILKSLKADMKAAETAQKEWTGKIEAWRQETLGLPYGNEERGKSTIVSKDIRKQLEWLIPTITDPFLSTSEIVKCNPITFEDKKAAEQNQLLLNTQFVRKFPRYNFINKSCRVLTIEGTVVVQTGWDYEDEEVVEEVEVVKVDEYGMEYVTYEEQTITKVIKNQPTAIVCRNEDIFVDPTCMDDMDKCQFIIHRYETDLSTLRADGRYKNLDKVAQKESGDDYDFDPEDKTMFKFDDKARKKIVVHEYWGNYDIDGDGVVEPIVCAWVGDILIRLEDNPYPDKKPPFIIVPFNSVPFQLFGEALAENIGDNQKIKTAINRGILDNMAKSNNAMIGIRRGALDMANRKKFLAGKNFEFNGTPNDFWQGSYNQIPGSVFDILHLQNNEIESQTGTKSFSGGITGNALGGTATGARGVMDATATRRLHLVRNIAENLIKPLMRKWMVYNAEFLEEEEVIRITNDEYIPIRRDDLEGRVDIELTIATAEDNAARAQELSFLLQTLGNTVPFELTQMVLAEIVKLGRMPDVAKAIQEFKPQPDPAEEQMKQIQMQKAMLEIEKLKVEIHDIYTNSGEDEADRVLKINKAKVEAAKARKLESDADLGDIKFLKEDNEYERYLDNERADRDFRYQRELALLQRRLGGPNEQIGIME